MQESGMSPLSGIIANDGLFAIPIVPAPRSFLPLIGKPIPYVRYLEK
jgi:hypothetical protein